MLHRINLDLLPQDYSLIFKITLLFKYLLLLNKVATYLCQDCYWGYLFLFLKALFFIFKVII